MMLRRHIEIEQQRLVDVEHARSVLGPLQIAAHPVKRVSDAGKHFSNAEGRMWNAE